MKNKPKAKKIMFGNKYFLINRRLYNELQERKILIGSDTKDNPVIVLTGAKALDYYNTH